MRAAFLLAFLMCGCRPEPVEVRSVAAEGLDAPAEEGRTEDSGPTCDLSGELSGLDWSGARAIAYVRDLDAGGRSLESIAIYLSSSAECGDHAWSEWKGAVELTAPGGALSPGKRITADARFHPHIEEELPCPGHPDYHFGLGSGSAWIEIDAPLSLPLSLHGSGAIVRGRLHARSTLEKAFVDGRFEAFVCDAS